MAFSIRYTLSELLATSRGAAFNKLYQGSHNVQVVRTLYADTAMGLDKYLNVRERVQSQFTNIADSFRTKMSNFNEPNSTHMVFTEDLKNMLHLVEPENKMDLDLVMNMIKRYSRQNKELRFGTFIFGPVIMRMLHFLNEPLVALEAFKNPELDGLFDQVTSAHVLLDLLYKNKRYQDILDVFDIIRKKQVHGATFAKSIVCMTTAACYKMNTPESWQYCLQLLEKITEIGGHPIKRAVNFAAGLALNQNAPFVCLEMLSTLGNSSHPLYINLKVSAFADVGRPEDAFPLLRYMLQRDDENQQLATTNTICKETWKKLKTSVTTSGNEALIREFEELEKAFIETKKISSVNLDEMLCEEIKPLVDMKGHNRQFIEASYSRDRQEQRRRWKAPTSRPGLLDLE